MKKPVPTTNILTGKLQMFMVRQEKLHKIIIFRCTFLCPKGYTNMKVSECSGRPILSPCGLKEFDYQVDTYIGCEHYCYYCYVLDQAETDWSKEIRMHNDIVSQLSEEIDTISPQTIYMGYQTDPYQPCEAEYHQTSKVLELFLQKGYSASILTKSDLVEQIETVIFSRDHIYWSQLREDLAALKNDRQLNLNIHL